MLNVINHINIRLKLLDKNIYNFNARLNEYYKGNFSKEVDINFPHIERIKNEQSNCQCRK